MWIKGTEGLFNSTGYRSFVAEHFEAGGPGEPAYSTVTAYRLGGRKRGRDFDPEEDPFDVVSVYEGLDHENRAENDIDKIRDYLSGHGSLISKVCDLGSPF